MIAAVLTGSCSSATGDADQPASPSTTTSASDDASPGPSDDALADPTPLGLDDEVSTGTLDNGLTYYLRHNDSPGESITIRLVVDAGSRQQAQADDGVAHFLEHMMFNGTARWPGNELDRVLQTIGAGIGPDLNAYTSLDETVYELTITTTDPTAVTTGFTVMAEWAHNATIEEAEVIAERGVVRDEYRQRVENPDGAVGDELFAIYLLDTPYEGRMPLGAPEQIDSTAPDALRAFYDTWYHPENMAVVVVGDLDVDDMLAELETAFVDVTGRGDAPARPVPLTIEPDPEGRVAVVTHSDLVGPNLSVDWLRPPSDPATTGGARTNLLDDLVSSMLERRLDDAYRAGALSVDRAPYFERFSVARHLSYFGTNLRGPDLATAYAELLGYLAGAADAGFAPEELADAVEAHEAGLDAWADTLGTTQDFAWSDAYVSHFLTGAGGEAPTATIARERAILAEVTIEEVSDRWATVSATSGPITVAIGATAADVPTVDELAAVAAAVRPIDPVATEAVITELLATPTPVKPVGIDTRAGVYDDIHVWRYANGATVVFERSPIEEGFLRFTAEALGGASTLPADDYPLAVLATSAVGQSGVGEVSSRQLRQFLSSSTATLSPFIEDHHEGFEGAASGDDAETLFQLLHLAVTAPQVDATVMTSVVVDAEQLAAFAAVDPGFQSYLALREIVFATDRYSGLATPEQLETVTAERLLAIYLERLGRVDDLFISIAGDSDADVIRALADHYVGSLPAGPADTFSDFSGPPVTTIERVDVPLPDGSGDGGVILRWARRIDVDPSTLATAALLEQIVNAEIFDTAREELGASYGGEAIIGDNAGVPEDGFEAIIAIDGDPDRIDEITVRILDELDRFGRDGPTTEEFDRARALLLDRYGFITNRELILGNLADERGQAHLTTQTRSSLLAAVTASDVRRLAGQVFDLDAYVDVRRR